MHRIQKHYLRAAAMASLLLSTAAHAPADSLVTVDGEMMVGPVTKTATGYTIETADGPVTLPAEKVKRVLYDHPPAAGATPNQTTSTDPASTTTPKKAVDPRTLAALIDQGETAFAAAQYGDARDAFKDALIVDPKNALAGRGLGFAYLALAKPTKALDPLEIAARNPPLDRSLVLALASSLVADHNSIRAVKYLKPYLESHGQPADETMLNALGICLSQADSSAAKSALFQDAVKLYVKLNGELEATVKGKKRWGVEWMDSADVKAKQDARQQVQDQVNAAQSKLQAANAEMQAAQAELGQLGVALGKRDENRIRNAQQKLNQATDKQAKAQTDYDTISKTLAGVPAPAFPTQIVVDDADLVMTPPPTLALVGSPGSTSPGATSPAKPGTVATATPAQTPPLKPARHPKPVTPQTPDATPKPPGDVAAADPPQPAAPKHVTRYAVAFAIAPDVLVTSADAVEGATDISIETADGKSMTATILRAHHADGLALLKVEGAKFPCLALATTQSAGELSCFGFPEVDLFNPLAHSMNVSAGPDSDTWKVRFDTSPRLPGGPLLQDGHVVGVELGDRDSELDAVPAATLKMLTSLVEDSANPSTPATDPKRAVVQVMAER